MFFITGKKINIFLIQPFRGDVQKHPICTFIIKSLKFTDITSDELDVLIFIYIGIIFEIVGVMFTFFRGIYMEIYEQNYGAYYTDPEVSTPSVDTFDTEQTNLVNSMLAHANTKENSLKNTEEFKPVSKVKIEEKHEVLTPTKTLKTDEDKKN